MRGDEGVAWLRLCPKERRQVSPESVESIRRALIRAGVESIDENGGRAGVRLRKPHQAAKRKYPPKRIAQPS
jgi:hypothetical protein